MRNRKHPMHKNPTVADTQTTYGVRKVNEMP